MSHNTVSFLWDDQVMSGDWDSARPFAKLGFMVLGLAIVIGAVRGCSACYEATDRPESPPVVEILQPDLSPPMPSEEVMRDAMEHMQKTIEKAGAEEKRRERKKKRSNVKYGVQWEGEPPP